MHFGLTFIELDQLGLHLSSLTYLGLTFLFELDDLVCLTFIELDQVDLYLSNLTHFGITFIELDQLCLHVSNLDSCWP